MERWGRHAGKAALTAVLPWLLSGCASQAPVRPPSLHLPAAVHGLSAQRAGGSVDLAWTNPTRTTDGVSLRAKHGSGLLQAEICRAEVFLTASCTPIAHLPAVPGEPLHYHDVLPSAIAEGAPRLMVYRIRLINSAGKGAGWTEVKTLAGAAPAPVAELRAAPVAEGILVQWKPGEGGVMLRVSRGADMAHTTLLSADDDHTAGRQPHAASSGTLDTGGHAGEEQRYTAFRRRTLNLEGQTFVFDSDPESVTVAATAKLPLPLAPASLEVLANTLGTPEADLVWQPPNDPGITGYRVYREENGAAVLLTPDPLRGFTYADKAVQTGHTYRYVVASVNGTGERRGETVSITIP